MMADQPELTNTRSEDNMEPVPVTPIVLPEFTMDNNVLNVEHIITTILSSYSMDTISECKITLATLSKLLRSNYNLVVYYNLTNYDCNLHSIPVLIKNTPKLHNINTPRQGRYSTTPTTNTLIVHSNMRVEKTKVKPHRYARTKVLENTLAGVLVDNRISTTSTDGISEKHATGVADFPDSADSDADSLPEAHIAEEIPLTTYGVYTLSGTPVQAKMMFRNFSKPVSHTMSRQGIINLMDAGYKIYDLLDGTRLVAYYDFATNTWKYASNNSADISGASWRGYTFAELIQDTDLDTDGFDKYCVYNLVMYNPKVHSYGGYQPRATIINVFDADGNPMYPELWQKPLEIDTDQPEYIANSLKLSHLEYKKFIRGEIAVLGNFMGYIFRHNNISYTCYALYSKLYSEIRKMLYNNKSVDIERFGDDKYLVCMLYVRYSETDIVQKLIPSVGARVNALRERLTAIASYMLYTGADHNLIRAKNLIDVARMYELYKQVLTDNELIFYNIALPVVKSRTKITTIYRPAELQAKQKLIIGMLTTAEYYDEYRRYLQF